MPVATPPSPFQPLRTPSIWRRHLWLLPAVLAGVFCALVMAWAEVNDHAERKAFQRMLQADASSVQGQLQARQEVERNQLRNIARQLDSEHPLTESAFAAMSLVQAGLDRLWNRLVWIDDQHQIVARAERKQARDTVPNPELQVHSRGQAEHLSEVVPAAGGRGAGQLLARYEITDLLRSTDLGWLHERYQVAFVSDLGEVIASTATPSNPPQGAPYEHKLGLSTDTTLVLTPFDAPEHWWRSARTLALLGGLLLLGGGGSVWLRQEMQRVAKAVTTAQTEAAWRQSMEDSALVGLRARDRDGRILYVNKTLCDMVGYAKDELVGLVPPLPFWPADAVDAMMARNLDTLAGGAPSTGYETRWNHRDGHSIDVMIFESPLLASDGHHIGWMGSIVDISDRKALEEKDRRHIELMAQHARLSDLGLLASELAHELNQPLAAVIGYSAGLGVAFRKQDDLDPDLLEAVDAVQSHARRAGDIVNWIRRQTSRTQPERQPVDINALVNEVVGLRQRHAQRLHTRLVVEAQSDLPMITADRVGLEQVLNNLIRNALDALVEQNKTRQVIVRTESAGASMDRPTSVTISVEDNGPGIGGKTLDELCTTFFSTKEKGLGLGLGICRSIIEAHGGTLEATTASSGGALFRCTLPINTVAQKV